MEIFREERNPGNVHQSLNTIDLLLMEIFREERKPGHLQQSMYNVNLPLMEIYREERNPGHLHQYLNTVELTYRSWRYLESRGTRAIFINPLNFEF
jgi:hypothetical protein